MDNDNKIESTELLQDVSKRHKEVLLFLDEELQNIQDESGLQSYNLEEEYSKTKKNRNWFPIILLSCVVVFIGVLAFVMNRVITSQNDKITVNLEEFSDLNLKSLLDNVAKVQGKYDQSLKNKMQLEAALESRLKDAQNEKENDIFLLDSLKIRSQKEYNNRMAEIVKNHSLKEKQIHEEYDEQILVAEKELEQFKAELDQFDTVKIEAAKSQEKALNSERQLRDLETQELTEKYEKRISELESKIENMRTKNSSEMRNYMNELKKKYEAEIAALDPVLNDKNAKRIVTSTQTILDSADESQGEVETEESVGINYNDVIINQQFDVESFIQKNEIKDAVVIDALNEYKTFYQDYNYLDSAILDLPHKNSIPEYVTASRVLVNEMGQALAESTANMSRQNTELQKNIESLNADVEKQKNLLSAEKKAHKTDVDNYEKKIVDQRNEYDDVISASLTLAKTNAVILSAESADNIKVYVVPKIRESVTEEGLPAEVKAGKTVKGFIKKNEKGEFYFEVGLDKSGTPIEFDYTLLITGTALKTTSK